ncbi:MAG: hypothetical protein H0W62_11150 [Chitinophagales bacterium]|nr:hypothetical protein [Chitinophagales bacterium]
MKKILIAVILLSGFAITSCKSTTQTDNQTMSNDTMVMRPDSNNMQQDHTSMSTDTGMHHDGGMMNQDTMHR